MIHLSRFKSAISLGASKKLTLFLFFCIALFLVPETFNSSLVSFDRPVKILLFSLLFINLLCCTFFRFKQLKRSTRIIHIGCLISIAGSLAGNLGFVATVNVYEGSSTYKAYRWDLQRDEALGFELKVKTINREYYPIEIKIGVLEDGKKKALFQVKSGETFSYKNSRVTIQNFDLTNQTLGLQMQNGEQITHITTTKKVTSTRPLDFKLVAFKNPSLKRIWVDLAVVSPDGVETTGRTAVNSPFQWQGLRFFNTENGRDLVGQAYAGIQIVKDPGIPLVYIGFALILLGCLGILARAKSR